MEVKEVLPPKGKLDRLIFLIGRKFCILYLVFACIICYEVISRYVFNSPTSWVHETTTFIAGIMFIWGGVHSLAVDKHISISVVYDMLPNHYRFYADVIISTLMTICLSFLTYTSFLLFKSSWFKPWGDLYMETTGSAWNPPFPALVKLFLFLVLILMLIQVIVRFISNVRNR